MFKKLLRQKSCLLWIAVAFICVIILLTGDVGLPLVLMMAPLFLTAVAKVISSAKGAEGKMSRTYKDEHTRNRRFYRLFCALLLVMPIGFSAQNTFHFDTMFSISTKWENIISAIYLAVVGVCAVGWIVTEVVRKNDFPWGIFRLVERLVYAVLLTAGAYLALTLVFSIFKENPTLGKIFVYGGMIVAVVLFFWLAWMVFWWMVELVLIIFRVDREKRKAIIEEMKTAFEGSSEKTEWEEASSRDWLGREYRLYDSWGNSQELRRKSDGTYIDRGGNHYKQETFWDKWKNA